MTDTIWGAIIGLLGTILGIVAEHLRSMPLRRRYNDLSNNKAVISFLRSDENFNHLLGSVPFIYMYTVNSYLLYNQINNVLNRTPKMVIKKMIILVRYKHDESESDLEQLTSIISGWKNLVDNKKIKKLTIIGYTHDPDHYYTILGNRIVFSGQVLYDKSLPTGTTVDFFPLVFNDESDAGKQVIKNYQNHFANVVSRFKDQHTLYESFWKN